MLNEIATQMFALFPDFVCFTENFFLLRIMGVIITIVLSESHDCSLETAIEMISNNETEVTEITLTKT